MGARMNSAVELALRSLPVQDGPRVEGPGVAGAREASGHLQVATNFCEALPCGTDNLRTSSGVKQMKGGFATRSATNRKLESSVREEVL